MYSTFYSIKIFHRDATHTCAIQNTDTEPGAQTTNNKRAVCTSVITNFI